MNLPANEPNAAMSPRRAAACSGECLVEWPHCPACGVARSTRCPACDTSGESWEQAFGVPPANPAAGHDSSHTGPAYPAAVICPTCDEVFRPKFARRCAHCGHAFANDAATAMPDDQRLLSDETAGEKHRRSALQTARMILIALAAAAVAYTLYDWLMSNTGGARMF